MSEALEISFPPISPIDDACGAQARELLHLSLPGASVGRLANLAGWLAACQHQVPPAPPTDTRLVVFASQEDALDDAPGTVFAEQVGCRNVTTVVPDDDPVASGRDAADRAVDEGAQLLIPAATGPGVMLDSVAAIGAITRTEPVKLVRHVPQSPTRRWQNAVATLRDAMFQARTHTSEPRQLLATIGSAELAATVGFLAQAAVRRTPCVLDDVTAIAAAVIANTWAPGAAQWWIASDIGVQPAAKIGLDQLGLTPLFDYGFNRVPGAGGALTIPLIRTAASLVADPKNNQENSY